MQASSFVPAWVPERGLEPEPPACRSTAALEESGRLPASTEADAPSHRTSWAGFHPFRPHLIARASIERRVGAILAAVRDREASRALGHVRFGDYVAERLGFSPRTAQELIPTAAALQDLPLLAVAFEREEITSGHVGLLTRVAGPESEAFWVRLARATSVKELARAIALASTREEPQGVDGELPHGITQASTRADSQGADGPRTAAEVVDPEGAEPDPAGVDLEEENRWRWSPPVETAGGVGVVGSSSDVAPGPPSDTVSSDLDLKDETPLERLEISAPAWIAAFWRSTVTLVRQLSGGRVPAGEWLEVLLAEAAAGRTGVDTTSAASDAYAGSGGSVDHVGQLGRLTLAGRAGSDADLQPSARAGWEAGQVHARSPDAGLNATDLHPSARGEGGYPAERLGGGGLGTGLQPSARSGEREADNRRASVSDSAAISSDLQASARGDAWEAGREDACSSGGGLNDSELQLSARVGPGPSLATHTSNPRTDAFDLQASARGDAWEAGRGDACSSGGGLYTTKTAPLCAGRVGISRWAALRRRSWNRAAAVCAIRRTGGR